METGGPEPAMHIMNDEPGGGPSNSLVIPAPLQGIAYQIAEKVGSEGALGFILSVEGIVTSVEEMRQQYIQSRSNTTDDVDMKVLESRKSTKLDGVESKLEVVEYHIEKLNGIGPNDPDPHQIERHGQNILSITEKDLLKILNKLFVKVEVKM